MESEICFTGLLLSAGRFFFVWWWAILIPKFKIHIPKIETLSTRSLSSFFSVCLLIMVVYHAVCSRKTSSSMWKKNNIDKVLCKWVMWACGSCIKISISYVRSLTLQQIWSTHHFYTVTTVPFVCIYGKKSLLRINQKLVE